VVGTEVIRSYNVGSLRRRMDLRSPLGLLDPPPQSSLVEPQFLLELEPRTPAFVRNLRDTLLFRTVPRLDEFPKAPFWGDVFVKTRTPWAGLSSSTFAHAAVVAGVYVALQLPMFQTRPQTLADPFENRTITYYQVSEYLPPINLNSSPARRELKGEPAPAKQEILSVPPEPDNSTQTIVSAPQVKLREHVNMPNLVVWEDVPVAQPTAASEREVSQLSMPRMNVDVVDAAADVTTTEAKLTLPWLRPQVIEPQADVSDVSAQRARSFDVAVVEPVATVDNVRRPNGKLNMAPSIDVVAPKLPVVAQRATAVETRGSSAGPVDHVPPPPSSTQGLQGPAGVGRLIALNLSPSNITVPVQMPGGNRSGVFASGPSGKEGAPGTPTLKAGGTGTGGTGLDDSKKGPAGISIGAAPAPAAPTNARTPISLNDAQKQVLMASLAKPSLPPPRPTPIIDAPATGLEGQVFGGKKFYSMVLNMPNLTSRSGSWVIKFAELKQTEIIGDLLAPVATLKVDPAYPPELMRDRVEGTVVLYAVIHSDGHVDDVRVLSGVDSRLDRNAIRALSKWHFRPATKNGRAVALEAVVQIPFRVSSPL
jgi:TonB family protein